MSISHIFHIFYNFICKFPICIESIIFLTTCMTFPRTHMYFVDGNRIFLMIPFFSLLHPILICPLQITDIRNFRCRSRSHLKTVAKWICLINKLPRVRFDTEFIKHAFLYFWNKTCINSQRLCSLHRILFLIPIVKFSDN